ncbi:hypothetical protein VNI00_019062 [Paramarasmius palmivorus]|uniref:Uncharacterized protein n=1 Tax=Paramarasmius palmivorus TaxID=297713 RepID=A0AAW0ARJ4_9AGAR
MLRKVIALSCSLVLSALGSPTLDFIASFISNIVVPSTGTVNIPVSAKWKIPSFLNLPPPSYDGIQIILVQDKPIDASSTIDKNYKPGQTEGVIEFTPTRTGTYHLEVSGFLVSTRIGNDITITDPSTQIETQAQTNTMSSISYTLEPHSTDNSLAATITTAAILPSVISPTVASTTFYVTQTITSAAMSSTPGIPNTGTVSSTPGIPTTGTLSGTPGIPTTTQTPPTSPKPISGSLLGAILGTIIGVIVIIAVVSAYLWYRRSSSRASARVALDKNPIPSSPWWTSPQYNLGKRSRSALHSLSEDDAHASSLAPSDSVSQKWVKEKVFEKRRPLRESTDLTVIMEKGDSHSG